MEGNRLIRPACLFAFALLCTGARGEVVSITEKPIPVTGNPQAIDSMTGPSADGNPASTGAEFVEFMSLRMKGEYPAPSVLVADPAATFDTSQNPGEMLTWSETFNLYTSKDAHRYCTFADGVTVIGFGEEPKRTISLSLASGGVPPLVIVANDGAQLMQLWHEVSGIEIRYDKASAAKEIERARGERDAIKAKLVGQEVPTVGEFDFPLRCSRSLILAPKSGSLDELMNDLASRIGCIAKQVNGAWEFVAPAPDEEMGLAVRKLLNQLRAEPYGRRDNVSVRALAALGEVAVPAIAGELDSSYSRASGFYYLALTEALALTPCAARDEAFLRALQTSVPQDRDSLCSLSSTVMIASLAENHTRGAVEVLEKAAVISPSGNVREAARVALANLGAPLPSRPVNQLVVMDSTKQELANSPEYAEAFGVLAAVVDAGFEPGGLPLMLTTVETKDGRACFRGKWRSAESSKWEVRISPRSGDSCVIEASYWCGPLCGEGFEGKASMSNGRWLIVEWRMTYIS